MCGICGQYTFTPDNYPVSAQSVQRMTSALAHRGPDDQACVCRGQVGFGFSRLSIIDLAGGRQPMLDSEGSAWLVFNGEIYNFRELRSELESYGHRFRTRSDTEVILHGYKQWGIDVLEHLNGMFGLAIWDDLNRRLMLARDRLGIKPVYYRLTNREIIFGSEIRAITAHDGRTPEVDLAGIHLFLQYRYTPAPLTPFKGIRKLAAGTRLIVEKGVPRIERWWTFQPRPFEPMPSVHEAEETLLELYRTAVKRQLVSDVPVGLFLSGGNDSALLLALMSETRREWKAYTIAFAERFSHDELSRASAIAQHFQSQDIAVELTRDEFEESLYDVVRSVEEPVAADSIVPMYFLSKRARQDVKVALMGQGPDELFGGYRRHVFTKYAAYVRGLPKFSHRPLHSLLQRAVGGITAERLFSALKAGDPFVRYRNTLSQVPAPLLRTLFRDHDLTAAAESEIRNCWQDLELCMKQSDELSALHALELRSTLPDELLLYADKLSMAHGLEVRVPYLDHEVVEYAERLSSSFKVRNGTRKWLHRRVCRQLVPGGLVSNTKIGFETPTSQWFRHGVSRTAAYLRDRDSRIYGFLHPEPVTSLLAEHESGKANHADLLFSLVALEVWCRTVCN